MLAQKTINSNMLQEERWQSLENCEIPWKVQPDRQFQNLIEKTSISIFVIQEERICYVNPIAELTTGYSRSQLLANSNFYTRLNPNGYKPDNLKQNYRTELKIKAKGGGERWLNCSWEAVRWDDRPGIAIAAIDVTSYIDRLQKLSLSESEAESDSVLPSTSEPQLQEIFDYIEAHYHESISLIDVATEVGYSAPYLTDLVKRQTGTSINRWIIKRRLAAAESLLQKTNYSIEKIAEEIGYLNPSHFFRQFRKYMGTTPKVWRRKHRG